MNKVDWSWNKENCGYKKPVKVSTKASKKAARRALSKKCYAARRQARSVIGNLTTGTSNRDYANALFSMGLIVGGPYGKKSSVAALVRWYEGIPVKDRVKKKVIYDTRIDRAKPFYDSRAWRELRYQAFTKNGRQCQCCGAKPPQIILHVDHIKPRSLHPELELDIDNLQILCEDCNLGKSNKDDTDFR